jgi:adenine-specific DNA glycosylase
MNTSKQLLPSDAKHMEAEIPGIGRYSAGAICSIAYGEQVPVVSQLTSPQCIDLTRRILAGW